MNKLSPDQDFLARQTCILCASYQHWTGLPLVEAVPDSADAVYQLFHASFAIVSHDTQANPIFNYANQQALKLFGMSWDEFTRLPSRYSAEPMVRQDRADLLKRVTRDGYVDDYSGIRIAKDGRRFMIRNATVWSLLDHEGVYCGQAALINDWAPLA
ncbi:MAG: MEKHLA domain-containing protein [Methylophilaceae bacterium]